jgi:co-chaperonin GroES (HSP10)
VDDNGFYTTRKNIVLNNDLLTKKQMNDLQNIPLKKGGIITLNDFEKESNDIQNIPLKKGDIVTSNDYNDDYITYDDPRILKDHYDNLNNERYSLQFWQSLPISNYRFNEDDGLVGVRDLVVKLLANKKLTTEDR